MVARRRVLGAGLATGGLVQHPGRLAAQGAEDALRPPGAEAGRAETRAALVTDL